MRTAQYLLMVTVALVCVVGTAGADYPFPVDADSTYNPGTPQWRGQAGLTFLQIGGSARAEGMGGAFSAVSGDPSTVFYNPAGMAAVDGVAAYLGNSEWFADMSLNHFVLAVNTGMFTAGISYVDMDYGDIPGTIIADNVAGYEKIGNLSPVAWAMGAFVAVQFTDRFAAGFHPKFAVQDFGANAVFSYNRDETYMHYANDNRVSTFAIDLGTQYKTGLRNLTINMSLVNFAQSQRYVEQEFDLPLTYRVGFAAEVIELVAGYENPTNKVMLYVDGVDRRDVPLDAAVGVEYIADLSSTMPGFGAALRGGRRASSNQDASLSFGGGVTLPVGGLGLTVDYSYNDYGPELTASRFGLSIRL